MNEIIEKYLNGATHEAYKVFGAHRRGRITTFTVYAPNAHKVSLAGDFNDWNYDEHYMTRLDNGIFQIKITDLPLWSVYKYGVYTSDTEFREKSDPFGFYHEEAPAFGTKVVNLKSYKFKDAKWMKERSTCMDKPLNIYEMHVGSWLCNPEDTYVTIAEQLAAYVKEMGYTHIEIMPISEYPFDGSWGYQVTGFYSVTSRHGSLDQFKEFVDIMHRNGIGVILDIVPVHFVKDDHGLRLFDGTPLYEIRQDTEWSTLYFDYYKQSVQNFFISSAAYWLEMCHIDGLRMDAISHLIYLSGRKDFGVNETGIYFLRKMNGILKENYPEVLLIAEDSSDYGGVTHTIKDGGLGFDYKWDLGWMNDTLKYYELDPIYKKESHHKLTWSMAYFYNERFILPLSHDEVVHGKKTIVDKMWGTYEEKFALARNLYMYMFTLPGKKLNFMGNELGHLREWDEKKPLDWFLLDYPMHDSFKRYMNDLNLIYKSHPSLSAQDFDPKGFQWIDVNNVDQSIYSYMRFAEGETLVVVLNMTPVSYEHYRIGVNQPGTYSELINSERSIYTGCDMTNYQPIKSETIGVHGYEHSIDIRLAPYAGVIFKLQDEVKKPARKKATTSKTNKTTKKVTKK